VGPPSPSLAVAVDRVSSRRFVGRQEQLAALVARVTAAAAGEPSLTLLRGEAGIGKSRLLRELEERATSAGALVLHGECLQLSGGEFPYAPIVAALRSADREVIVRALAALPNDGRAEVARLVPELAAGAGPTPAADGGAFARARLFELLLALMQRIADAVPLVVVIEDAHWADTSTRDFLVYLVPNLARARIAIVASYRPDEVPRGHPLRMIVSELKRRREVCVLTVPPLSREEVVQQLDEILERRVEHAVVEDIHGRADGNPFYVEELLAARRAGHPGGVDEGMHDTLLTRVDALSEDTQRALQALAAIGRPAAEALLGNVSGLHAAALSRALHEAIDRHVLLRAPDPSGVDGFDFRHALMRDAVAQDLTPGERRMLHRAVAHALVEAGDANPAELAFHWQAAGETAAAFTAHVAAGRAMQGVYAFNEAHGHFERALELFATVRGDDVDRVELIGRLAEAKRLIGDCDGAAELIEEALTLVDAERQPLRAATLYERLGAYRFWDDERALSDYDRALALIPHGHLPERAHILSARALALHNLTRWEEAREQAQAALALTETPRAHLVLGTALAFLGDPLEGERHLRRSRELADAGRSAEDRAKVFSFLAEVLRLRGDVEGALAVMLEGEATCARLGMSRSYGDSMTVNAAEDLLWLGRWDEADARLAQTERLQLRDAACILSHTVAGQLAVARGDAQGARHHLDRARAACGEDAAPDYRTAMHAGWAELALWEHRPEAAYTEVAAHLEEIGDLLQPLYAPVLHSLGCRAAADAALRLRSTQDRAAIDVLRRKTEALISQLEHVVERYGRPAHATAHLALCHAELARLRREPADRWWKAAARRWEELAHPYPAAYARYRQAEALLLLGGRRHEGASVLADAREVAERLGAKPLLEAVDHLFLVQRLPSARPADEPERPPSAAAELGLTPREVEILTLVAQGCTNRHIAERLFISTNTVRVHVSKILTKLDVPRRVEAATAAHHLGLLDGHMQASDRLER
jgi:DNA-binding CsgD family transcriptional regulator/tetratricopeptide (TPR) repeat protein